MNALLTRKDVGERLGVSLPTVDRLIARDDFPKIRLGRCVKIPEVMLDEWIQRNIGQEVTLK